MKTRILTRRLLAAAVFVGLFTACPGHAPLTAPLQGGLINSPKQPPSGNVTIAVTPGPVNTVTAGGTLQLTATVTGTSDQSVTWSIVDASGCGSVSASGLYTAPATPPASGTCHVKATSNADPTKSASVTIRIGGGVVGCVAPVIPGFSGFYEIYSNRNGGQVDGPMGPGGTAQDGIDHANGIVDDGNNHFFIPDLDNGGVRKIDFSVQPPVMSTVVTAAAWKARAGNTTGGKGIALLPNGDIVVSDDSWGVIWRVTQAGVMSVFAGTEDSSGYQDGPALSAKFSLGDSGMTTDAQGNVYVADSNNHAIRKVDATGTTVSTVAGGPSLSGYLDGPVATAKFNYPSGVVVDCNGNVVVADESGDYIRRIILTGPNAGTVVTVAGTGSSTETDNANPLQAGFAGSIAVSVDSGNNIIVSDHDGAFRRIDAGQNTPGADGTKPNGAVTTPFGPHQPGNPLEYIAFTRDGNPVLVINNQRIVVTIYNPPPAGVSVVVSPQTFGLRLNDFRQMVALVFGAVDQTVTWSIVEASGCGSVSASGGYSAPGSVPSPVTCHIKATSNADNTKSGTATVTITAS